ncbi:peptidoglycan binding domain containing protein [Colletotrichum truncatum]|uniref:Peptidoglycan binding domain containing protein n=1 Tax=Colletotrichum truncatum TaxID=5467 RepID=A0ACC3YEQ6_COLTU|nr:peptidoglycan binding domain containing protein [Colletotrichum truncatum]KAF6790249.1 peptidoglycan binding domain containing protein [Colletotrichum truncatum]
MEPLTPNTSSQWRSFYQEFPKHHDPSISPAGSASPSYYEQSVPVLETEEEFSVTYRQSADDHPFKPPSPSKRIIICCDGTWQSSVTGRKNIPSNVTRLARSIARTATIQEDGVDKNIQQVVFYSAGVGTGGGTSVFDTLRQATFGDGVDAEIIKAYNFLVMNYDEGDHVLCFGFSRGAYTARSVAGLVADIGIIKPEEMDDFPDLYKMYQNYSDDQTSSFRQSEEYRTWVMGIPKRGSEKLPKHDPKRWEKKPHSLPPEFSRVVEVVGVFDTVGALGIPGFRLLRSVLNYVALNFPYLGIDYVGFHNTSLSKYVKHAIHALALDEHIKPFTPTLWHLPRDKKLFSRHHRQSPKELEERFQWLIRHNASEEQLSVAWSDFIEAEMAHHLQDSKPQLQQVWFPGGHVNIGGGNPAILRGVSFDFEQLALISFTWMCDQIKPFVQLDNRENDGSFTASSTLAEREIKSRRNLISQARQRKNYGSFWPLQLMLQGLEYIGVYRAPPTSTFDVVDDAWSTGPIVDIFEILKVLIFAPIITFFLKLIPFLSSYRTPGGYHKGTRGEELGETNEMIHPAVAWRQIGCHEYHPKSLEGFTRWKKPNQKGSSLPQKYEWMRGNEIIPEYVIKSTDCISRRLAQETNAREFVASLVME